MDFSTDIKRAVVEVMGGLERQGVAREGFDGGRAVDEMDKERSYAAVTGSSGSEVRV